TWLTGLRAWRRDIVYYVDYERLPLEEFSENGGSIPHNFDPAQARRPCVLQGTHLAGDPPGPSDLVAELQCGAPLRPSGAPGRATQPGSGVTWNVGAHHPRRGAVAGFVRDSVHPKDLINLGTSSSSTGNSLERMGYPPEKKSRCGCM